METGYLTKQEAAKLLKVHPRTLMKWVNAGEIKAYRMGPLVRFLPGDIQGYAEGRVIVTDEDGTP
jgi:excisionase family DNA binding protein